MPNDSLGLRDRVAHYLLLIFAQPFTRLARPTGDDVNDNTPGPPTPQDQTGLPRGCLPAGASVPWNDILRSIATVL